MSRTLTGCLKILLRYILYHFVSVTWHLLQQRDMSMSRSNSVDPPADRTIQRVTPEDVLRWAEEAWGTMRGYAKAVLYIFSLSRHSYLLFSVYIDNQLLYLHLIILYLFVFWTCTWLSRASSSFVVATRLWCPHRRAVETSVCSSIHKTKLFNKPYDLNVCAPFV
jgi:hypothetical protein